MAKNVKVGFCFLTVDGWIITITIIYYNYYLGLEKVSVITTFTDSGIYTIVTSEELVVIDGIVASPYAV